MAKEHGLEEHKGKTIPAEVRSLADRIRKKQPDVSDEYAYRTAWDIYRSHTSEGKSYPNKSPESGLKREGGGTGPLSKEAFAPIQSLKNFFRKSRETASNIHATTANAKDTSANLKEVTENAKESIPQLVKDVRSTTKETKNIAKNISRITKQVKPEHVNRSMAAIPRIAKNLEQLSRYAKWGGGLLAGAATVAAASSLVGTPKQLLQYKHYKKMGDLDRLKQEHDRQLSLVAPLDKVGGDMNNFWKGFNKTAFLFGKNKKHKLSPEEELEMENAIKKGLYEGLRDREKRAEEIPGGKSSGLTPTQFNKEDLKKGTEVETKEHTNNDKGKGTEIAMDHIVEANKKDKEGKYTSDYYKELPKMEKKIEKKASLEELFLASLN